MFPEDYFNPSYFNPEYFSGEPAFDPATAVPIYSVPGIENATNGTPGLDNGSLYPGGAD